MSSTIPSITFPAYPLKGKLDLTQVVQICTTTLERDAALIEHIGNPDIEKQLTGGTEKGRRWALHVVYSYKLEITRYAALLHAENIGTVPDEIREALMLSPIENRLTPQQGYQLREAMSWVKNIVELEKQRVKALGSEYVQYMPADVKVALELSVMNGELSERDIELLGDAIMAVRRLSREADQATTNQQATRRRKGRSSAKAARAAGDRAVREKMRGQRGQTPPKGRRAA